MHFDLLMLIYQALPQIDGGGNVVAIVSAVGGASLYLGRKLTRIQTVLTTRGIEHEILMLDYCGRKGITLDELPTRAAQNQAKSQAAGSFL